MKFSAKGPVGVPELKNGSRGEHGGREGVKIGEILVAQGVLSEAQVARIVEEQRGGDAKPFGDLAERLFGINPHVIEDAWVEQYRQETEVTDLGEVDIDADCLRRINRRQAWQFHVLPIGDRGGQMQVATHAENLTRGLNFAGRQFGDPVLMLLAEREQLREFLMRHYPVPSHVSDFADQLNG